MNGLSRKKHTGRFRYLSSSGAFNLFIGLSHLLTAILGGVWLNIFIESFTVLSISIPVKFESRFNILQRFDKSLQK